MTTTFLIIENGKVFRVNEEKFKSLTVREVLNKGYIVRRDWLTGDIERYVGNDEAYFACKKKGEIKWLHEYFHWLGIKKGVDKILDMTVSGLGGFEVNQVEVLI